MNRSIKGYWWLPGASIEDSVAGTLTLTDRTLPVLDLMGSLEDEPSLLIQKQEHVILGLTEEGAQVTVLQSRGSTGSKRLDESVFSERWIAQAALLGRHIEDAEQARFSYLNIELDVLSEIVSSGLSQGDVSADDRSWQWHRPDPITASTDEMNVRIEVAPHAGFVHAQHHELQFWSVPRIRVEWREPVNLQTILEDGIYALADLCSLLAGVPANVDRAFVFTAEDPPTADRFPRSRVELATNPSRKNVDVERQGSRVTTLEESPVAPSDLIPGWLNLWHDEELQPLLDRFFTQDGRPAPFPDQAFLGLAILLEGFHKAEHGGDCVYADRLRGLFGDVSTIIRAVGAQREDLVAAVKDTRNTLAHGRRRTGDSTVEGWQLSVLNRSLDLVLRSFLLLRLGFDEEDLPELMRISIVQIRNDSGGVPWYDDAIR